MKTKAVRLYGKEDLRLEEFELPAIQDDQILAHIISDSVCMSTYKAMEQGSDHKRVPEDIDMRSGRKTSSACIHSSMKFLRTFRRLRS